MKDKNYDLSLGKWGPYNKEYLGASHIANDRIGASFNIELFPGFFRRSISATPSVCDGETKMWGANASLTHFVYRYELEWKDNVCVDAHFNIVNDKTVHIDCKVANNTAEEQCINLNLCASLQHPFVKSGAAFKEYRKRTAYNIAPDSEYINALDYSDIKCDRLFAYDGKYLLESERNFTTNGISCLGGDGFAKKEYYVHYTLDTEASSIGIRYSTDKACEATVLINDEPYTLNLHATDGNFDYVCLKFKKRRIKSIRIHPGGNPLAVDCIIIDNAEKAVFCEQPNLFEPLKREVSANSMILEYADSDYCYRITWNNSLQMIRRLYTNDAGRLLEKRLHDHVSEVFYDPAGYDCVYENIFTDPLYLKPHSSGHFRFTVSSAKKGEPFEDIPFVVDDIYKVTHNSDGATYAFSQNMMAYTTMLNVVYPIYARRGFIRHNTPGRNWDSLYSWDSGFIGMGLATIDFQRAYDCLNTYLTPVGDMHSPYIMHGSAVPTQIYLYHELVNRFPDKSERLKKLYPMVHRLYDFYSKAEGGVERTKSDILKTWKIFYNSGGWDDYPPQKALQTSSDDLYDKSCSYDNTAPVITTANLVLCAKIMLEISHCLEIVENAEQYKNDIKKYSSVIENNLWDETVGYYSYSVHGSDGKIKEFLQYSDRTNFNMGFDGIYPYIAGISNESREKRIKENIINGLFTKAGIGVVDKRAPYYTPYGYWNGSVWMPHQWILWKALIDKGEIELATRIAETALNIWKAETDNTYSCFECFMSENCRGTGFHQFSGLSTPVLMFFESLYKPGTITCGFLSVIEDIKQNSESSAIEVKIHCGGKNSAIILCLNEKYKYDFTVNGNKTYGRKLNNGAYAVSIPAGEVLITAEKAKEEI